MSWRFNSNITHHLPCNKISPGMSRTYSENNAPFSPYLKPVEDVNIKTQIQKACNAMWAGCLNNTRDAAQFYALERSADYQKCFHQSKGVHHAATNMHAAQQLLPPVQEDKLVEWCQFLGFTGHSVNDNSVAHIVQHILRPNFKQLRHK